jgi:hypothetical protein
MAGITARAFFRDGIDGSNGTWVPRRNHKQDGGERH